MNYVSKELSRDGSEDRLQLINFYLNGRGVPYSMKNVYRPDFHE